MSQWFGQTDVGLDPDWGGVVDDLADTLGLRTEEVGVVDESAGVGDEREEQDEG